MEKNTVGFSFFLSYIKTAVISKILMRLPWNFKCKLTSCFSTFEPEIMIVNCRVVACTSLPTIQLRTVGLEQKCKNHSEFKKETDEPTNWPTDQPTRQGVQSRFRDWKERKKKKMKQTTDLWTPHHHSKSYERSSSADVTMIGRGRKKKK